MNKRQKKKFLKKMSFMNKKRNIAKIIIYKKMSFYFQRKK